MRKLITYGYYYFKADTTQLRARATEAARDWCLTRHSQHWTDAYYQDFRSFTQSYIRAHCHKIAVTQLQKLGL